MASKAGRQAVSTVPPNSPSSQEYPSQVGSGLGSSQAGSQAGESATSQEASISSHSISTGEGPSQAGNNPSTQAGRQAVRHSARCRAPRPPKGIVLLPRQVALVPGKAPYPPIGFLKGLPQKILTLSGSLTYPANL